MLKRFVGMQNRSWSECFNDDGEIDEDDEDEEDEDDDDDDELQNWKRIKLNILNRFRNVWNRQPKATSAANAKNKLSIAFLFTFGLYAFELYWHVN